MTEDIDRKDLLTCIAEDPTACDRVWQHALHEETVFNERSNFFLLAEAMLLVFYATTIGDVGIVTLQVISGMGVLLTVLWVLINMRQVGDLKHAVARMEECLPDYANYVAAAKSHGWLRGSALPILCYLVPLVVGGIWIALLLEHLG